MGERTTEKATRVTTIRLPDSPEHQEKIRLLVRHAYLKYKEHPGGMKEENLSEFIRFLINYYYTKEIKKEEE